MPIEASTISTVTVALALAAVSGSAFAQSATGGAYAGGTLGLLSPDAKISDSGNRVTLGSTAHSLVPGIFAGYGHVVSGAFYLGAEAAYQFAGPDIDEIRISGTGRIGAKVESAWSVSATPGVVLSDKVLGYGRLGLGRMKAEAEGSAGSVTVSGSETYGTFLYGAGISYLIAPNLVVRGEWAVTDGEEKNGVQMRMSGFTAGVAYRF